MKLIHCKLSIFLILSKCIEELHNMYIFFHVNSTTTLKPLGALNSVCFGFFLPLFCIQQLTITIRTTYLNVLIILK